MTVVIMASIAAAAAIAAACFAIRAVFLVAKLEKRANEWEPIGYVRFNKEPKTVAMSSWGAEHNSSVTGNVYEWKGK